MPIKQITPMSAVNAYLQAEIDKREAAVIETMRYIGELCLAKARDVNSYTDRTGNLRSSTGYVLIKDGRVLTQSISKSNKGTDRETGVKEGKEFLQQLISQYPSGIVLIVVAGMNYAAYVAAKGYDVLDSAESVADNLANKLFKNFNF